MGLRFLTPAVYLRLGKDQECYGKTLLPPLQVVL